MKQTLLAVLLSLAAAQSGASVIIGSGSDGNCYPFSCFAGEHGAGAVYQQVYDASGFSGALDFDQINFFKSSGGLIDTASYSIIFSTTSKNVMGLDSDLSNNLGADQQVFGTFHLSGEMPDVLTLTGSTFHYDPSQGNLLMQVTVDTLTLSNLGSGSSFSAENPAAATSRAWTGTYNGTGAYALVTRFDSATATTTASVPEPATLAMLGLGLVGLGFSRRKI